jgi:hypothetical protein
MNIPAHCEPRCLPSPSPPTSGSTGKRVVVQPFVAVPSTQLDETLNRKTRMRSACMIGQMLDHYRIESKPCNRAMVDSVRDALFDLAGK